MRRAQSAGVLFAAIAVAGSSACSSASHSDGRTPALPWIGLEQPPPAETCSDSVALGGTVFASGAWQCCGGPESWSAVHVSWKNASTGASGPALVRIVNGNSVSPPEVAWTAQVPVTAGENALEIVAEGALPGERASASAAVTAYLPCRKIEGRVATADGRALTGVGITLGEGRPPSTVYTDVDGRFVVEAATSFPFAVVPSLPRARFTPIELRGAAGADDRSGLDFVGDHDGLPAWSTRLDAGWAVDAIPLDGAGALVAFNRTIGGGPYYAHVQGGWLELDGFGRPVRSGYFGEGMTSVMGATGDIVHAAGALADGTPVLAGSRTGDSGAWLWAVAQFHPEESPWGVMPKGGPTLSVRDIVRATGGGVWVVGSDVVGDFVLRARPSSNPWSASFDDVTGIVVADGPSGVYFAGSFGATSPRVLVVREDGDGRKLWSRAYGPGLPRAVVTDGAGAAVAADEAEGPRLLAVRSSDGAVRFSRAWAAPGASVRALSATPDGYTVFVKMPDGAWITLATDVSGVLTSSSRILLPKEAGIRGSIDGSAVAWTGGGVWRLDARGDAPFCGGGGSHAFPTERAATSEVVDVDVTARGGAFPPQPTGISMSPVETEATGVAVCSP